MININKVKLNIYILIVRNYNEYNFKKIFKMYSN